MAYVDLVDETICALITTPGPSGISVIRVSGSNSLKISRKISPFLPDNVESHRVYFGNLRESNGEIIDECLVTYFQKGRSFTGDEVIEISVHGGFSSANRVLSELLSLGCRAAEKGEFSFRSFYNGKMDLVQAEAVLAIINSRSDLGRSVAVRQLKGKTSQAIEGIESGLLQILAQLEAAIDFSTEDIEPYSLADIKKLIEKELASIEKLVAGFAKGKILNQGLRIVLVGSPNVGKSTIYNALLEEDKAIVSSIAGTTRDLLESQYSDFGLPIRLIDSAGLRDSSDEIERIGIQKTKMALTAADLIIFVVDGSDPNLNELFEVSRMGKPYIIVINKVDTLEDAIKSTNDIVLNIQKLVDIHAPMATIQMSCKKNQGIQPLKNMIEKMSSVDIDADEALITQHRHFDHLENTREHLIKALNIMENEASYDLLALEMQCALKEVYSLLGKEFDEQVLDKIFKQFCIGK